MDKDRIINVLVDFLKEKGFKKVRVYTGESRYSGIRILRKSDRQMIRPEITATFDGQACFFDVQMGRINFTSELIKRWRSLSRCASRVRGEFFLVVSTASLPEVDRHLLVNEIDAKILEFTSAGEDF